MLYQKICALFLSWAVLSYSFEDVHQTFTNGTVKQGGILTSQIVILITDTSRALIADLEGGESGSPLLVQEGAIVYGKASNTGVDPSSLNFEQYIEADADGDVASGEVLSRTTTVPAVGGSGSSSQNSIMFEMMEIDADGNKHTRTLSYEQALAEGQFVAAEESVKSTGSTSGSGTVKGKTKPKP